LEPDAEKFLLPPQDDKKIRIKIKGKVDLRFICGFLLFNINAKPIPVWPDKLFLSFV
jgi:hypothetical protein